jgi:hypothetical protein
VHQLRTTLFTIAVGSALIVSPASAQAPTRGDVDGDGSVTATDALAVLATIVGRPLPADWAVVIFGDANCDGALTAADALAILSYSVGRTVPGSCVGLPAAVHTVPAFEAAVARARPHVAGLISLSDSTGIDLPLALPAAIGVQLFAVNAAGDPLLAAIAGGDTTRLSGRSTAQAVLLALGAPAVRLAGRDTAGLGARILDHSAVPGLAARVEQLAASGQSYADDALFLTQAAAVIRELVAGAPPRAGAAAPLSTAAGGAEAFSGTSSATGRAIPNVPVRMEKGSGFDLTLSNDGFIAFHATSIRRRLPAPDTLFRATLKERELKPIAVPPVWGAPTIGTLSAAEGRVAVHIGQSTETFLLQTSKFVENLLSLLAVAGGTNPSRDALTRIRRALLTPSKSAEILLAPTIEEKGYIVLGVFAENLPFIVEEMYREELGRGFYRNIKGGLRLVLKNSLKLLGTAAVVQEVTNQGAFNVDYARYIDAMGEIEVCHTAAATLLAQCPARVEIQPRQVGLNEGGTWTLASPRIFGEDGIQLPDEFVVHWWIGDTDIATATRGGTTAAPTTVSGRTQGSTWLFSEVHFGDERFLDSIPVAVGLRVARNNRGLLPDSLHLGSGEWLHLYLSSAGWPPLTINHAGVTVEVEEPNPFVEVHHRPVSQYAFAIDFRLLSEESQAVRLRILFEGRLIHTVTVRLSHIYGWYGGLYTLTYPDPARYGVFEDTPLACGGQEGHSGGFHVFVRYRDAGREATVITVWESILPDVPHIYYKSTMPEVVPGGYQLVQTTTWSEDRGPDPNNPARSLVTYFHPERFVLRGGEGFASPELGLGGQLGGLALSLVPTGTGPETGCNPQRNLAYYYQVPLTGIYYGDVPPLGVDMTIVNELLADREQFIRRVVPR